jgi:CubicO group peptidase (beta-lactamase class C family)
MLNRPGRIIWIITASILIISCSEKEKEQDSWHPAELNDGLQVSDPAEQGMDPAVIGNAYEEAADLDNIYSLLVLKNGYLVAEQYFNGQMASDAQATASVTKSVVSALAGIALEEGFLPSTDKKLKDFFPEVDWDSTDPRKSEITVRHLLQMRSGYLWEEVYGLIDTLRSSQDWIPFLESFLLVHDPGTAFGYSNFTAHILGIIISRSADESLRSFAQDHLFNDMGVSIRYWPADAAGHNYGSGDICLTPRSLAKFGQMYLDNGVWNNVRILPAEWVDSSLQVWSPTTYGREIFAHIHELKYGYLWWTGTSGDHEIWFAWGHGGQMVVLIRDLNMVVVATASVPPGFDNSAWQNSKAVMELVGRFIEKI